MNIVQVTTEQYYSYIPLKGWESVEAAVDVYAQGFTRGSDATDREQVRAIGQDQGDFAAAFWIIASRRGNRNQLVEDMLAEAKTTLRDCDRWSKHYDYDGMGTSFFKTNVEVKVLDRQLDLYGLGIYAAYVGTKPEEGLAEHLGIPQALISSNIMVQTEPLKGNCFAFDFEQVIRKLDSVLGTTAVPGQDIAQAMMKVGQYGESMPGYALWEEGLRVKFSPLRVESRFIWEDPHGKNRRKVDTWKVEEATLMGLLGESYEEKGKREPPSFVIHLSDHRQNDWGIGEDIPIWQLERKERIIALTKQIADALSV